MANATSERITAPNMFVRLRGEAFWVAAWRGVGILAAFGLNLLLVRLLTKADYGEFVSLTSGLWFASLLAGGGIDHALVRNVSGACGRGEREQASVALWSGLFAGLLSAITVSLTAATAFHLGAFPLKAESREHLGAWILGANIAFTALLQLGAAALRSLHDLRLSSAVAGPNGGPIGTCLFAIVALGIWYFAELNLAGVLACCTFAMFVLIVPVLSAIAIRARDLREHHNVPRIVRSVTAATIAAGVPLLLGDVAAFVVSQLDLWIASAAAAAGRISTADLADFAAAKRLALLAIMPVVIANQTILASIPSLYQAERKEELQRLLSQSARGAFVVSLAILAVLLIAGGSIIGFIAGPQYSRAVPILAALVAGQTAVAAFAPAGVTLLMTGCARSHCLIQLCAIAILSCGGPLILTTFGLPMLAAFWGGVVFVSQFASYLVARFSCGVRPGIITL